MSPRVISRFPSRALLGASVCAFVAACGDGTSPPRPVALVVTGEPIAPAVAGALIFGISVAVVDENGRAISGQPLAVVASGGGSVSGGPTTTGSGPVSIGQWTLSTKSGSNTLTISSGSLAPRVLSVVTVGGPPAKLSATAPAIGVVGSSHAVLLTAKDQFDNPSPSAQVLLTVSGGGQIPASTALLGGDGTAMVPWSLGTVRGANSMTASFGPIQTRLDVVGIADAPATLTAVAGNGQTGVGGSTLPVAITLELRDRFGNPTASRLVSFAVTQGGGTLAGPTATSDTNGVATMPSWTLGKRVDLQAVSVTAAPLSATVTAGVTPGINFVLRYFGDITSEHRAVFESASARLRAMVTSGLGPAAATNFDLAANCGVPLPPLTETITNIVVYASVSAIDGPGGILARAGPCAFRAVGGGPGQPAIGIVSLDVADLTTLQSGSALEDVVLHELMHTLGFGSMWQPPFPPARLSFPTPTDPRYIGIRGVQGCRDIGGTTTCFFNVPAENTGGAGTFGAHWRESVFTNELMTGYLNAGANPISRMSLQALRDISWGVNDLAADTYSLPSAAMRLDTPRFHFGWEQVIGMSTLDELVPADARGSLLVRRPPPPR